MLSWLRRLFVRDSSLPPTEPARTAPGHTTPSPQPPRAEPAPPPRPRTFTVEVMGESYYKHILSGLVGNETPPEGVVRPARCIPEDDGRVRVEIEGAPVGYTYSKYWWHYQMTLAGVAADCMALITGRLTPGRDDPGVFDVTLDLALPPLDPEIVPHSAVEYAWDVVRESNYQPALRSAVRERAAAKPAAWVPLVMARLVRETAASPSVRVEIAGAAVGYLGKVAARQYSSLDNAPREVPAIIRRGNSWDLLEGDGDYSVSLSLPLPGPRS